MLLVPLIVSLLRNRLTDMTFTGLNVVARVHLLLFCLLMSWVFVQPSIAREGITPERSITSVPGDQGVPEWKILWDQARNFAKAGNYNKAASVYSELFRQKSNIEQANWEYCKVLQKTGDFTTAAKIIAVLLEKNAHNYEYLLAGGQAAAHGKDWEAATKYFGRAFEKDPTGEVSDIALEGLIGSLRSMGKKELALPLAERLIVRQPDNLELLQKTAFDANNVGLTDKARRFYKKLLEGQNVDDRVLLQAVKVFDIPGKENESTLLLEQYLKRHPEYLPFRHKLVEYYLNSSEYDAAVDHLIYLIDHQKDNDALLLKAGSVNLYQLGRPDKALIYYERYLQKHPNDKEIKQNIANIQFILANDFLTIVENDGAWLLWRDLAKVTPNRVAIYLQMADLLEAKGMNKEFIDILSIVHKHHPEDDSITMRLAQKYYDNKQYENAINSLDKIVQKRNLTKNYYLLRASIELELKGEAEALASYEAALQIDASDSEVRKTSIQLAGILGNVSKMKAYFDGGLKNEKQRPEKEVFLVYLDQLSENHLFREHELISNRYRNDYLKDNKLQDKIDIHLASSLRREGKSRKAEQHLRQLLKDNRSVDEVLYALIENALVDKNISAAKSWFGVLDKKYAVGQSEYSYDSNGFRCYLLKIKILKAGGEYKAAEDLLNRLIASYPQSQSDTELFPLLAEYVKELCWLKYHFGDYKSVYKLMEKHAESGVFDPEIIILHSLLTKKLKLQNKEKYNDNKLLISFTPRIGHLLATIDSALRYKEFDTAELQIQKVLRRYPESVVGRVLRAKLLEVRGKFDEAVMSMQKLNIQFPEESYFYQKLVEIEMRRGNYDKGIALLDQKNRGIDRVDLSFSGLKPSEDIEELLTLARLLWGEKENEKSLKIYRKILSPSIVELLSEKFRQKQMNYPYLAKEKTIWNFLQILLQSEPEIIAELMEPAFLVDNLTTEAGKIVTEHYELYSWQKLISNEYLTRKAIFEKNFTFAEQSSKRFVDEQGTQEGMVDLATIYGRIGKYRKEAQVYEAIQSTGSTSPELVESAKRSSQQFSPQNIFEASYFAKDGRGGFVDMETVSVGTSFWFSPDLDTDLRFSYSNNRYTSVKSLASASSNLLYGTATYEFAKDYELIFSGGAEKIDGKSNARFLHKLSLKGQLDEYFHTYVEWGKGLVYDTVMALEEGVDKQEIETGLYCETPLGLTLGGDFRHRNYSDNNRQNRFHGYALYGLFGETVHLSVRYDYQFFKDTESNPSADQTAEISSRDVLLYWSPPSYSENLLTLHFQHDFLGYQQGGERKLSYYAIDNSIGYDDMDIISYTGKFDIFLEMNPHFLLKGNFTFTKSDALEEKGLFLSINYRW